MDVRTYLARIGYNCPLAPTSDTLRALQRQHMLTVPFENLDIGLGREIVLDPERFVEKIVGQRRGGFCYELNGAFATLLAAAGFRVTLLSARVSNEQGIAGKEFDHLTLRIDLEDTWLGWPMSVSATTSWNRCGSSVSWNSTMRPGLPAH